LQSLLDHDPSALVDLEPHELESSLSSLPLSLSTTGALISSFTISMEEEDVVREFPKLILRVAPVSTGPTTDLDRIPMEFGIGREHAVLVFP